MAQQMTVPRSAADHAASKEAAKRRKAGNRPAANDGTPRDLNVRREAVARNAKRKQRLNDAGDYAVLLMQQYGNHTFTTAKKGGGSTTHPRFCTETTVMAMAHLRVMFDGNVVERQRIGAITPSVMDEVRRHFVLVCVRFHIVGAYGQTTVWYSEVLEEHRRSIMQANI
jgi:hypothetical protein